MKTLVEDLYIGLLLILSMSAPSAALGSEFNGELNAWITLERDAPKQGANGIRYLPSFQQHTLLGESLELDLEISANLYGIMWKDNTNGQTNTDGEIKAYRTWGRIFTDEFEVRIGLQKITFGPGKVLRSLQWFDQIDPQDPTKFTEGVTGILLRYYAQNNSNVWVWTLYGNDEVTGISPFASRENRPEFGGRLQIPMGNGEAGVSVHYRTVDSHKVFGETVPQIAEEPKNEKRVGVDGYWDVGIGLWFEMTHLSLEPPVILPEEQTMGTLGVDYTFDAGNGIYSSLEVMKMMTSSKNKQLENQATWLTALNGSYPLNFVDHLQFLGIWDIENEVTTIQTGWQRTYDDVLFNLSFIIRDHQENTSHDRMIVEATEPINEQQVKFLIQYNH